MCLSGTVVQDQIVYQVCTVELGFDSSDCLALSIKNQTEGMSLEEKVQPIAANLLMVKNLTEAVLSIFFTLFIGPWSDKFGRKPILVSTTVGFFLTYLTLMILHLLNVTLSAWFYVLAFVFVAMFGGHVTLFVAIYCYITDVSNEDNRSTILGLMEAVMCAGVVAGSVSSSYIYTYYGPQLIMSLATFTTMIALLWTMFIVEETRVLHYSAWEKFKGIFRTEHIRDLVMVCFKRRPGVDRGVLWTVVLTLGFSIFILQGVETVLFLFLREKFNWDVRLYTLYSAAATVCLIVSNLVTIYIVKRITKVSDETLAILAFISAFVSSLTVAFATQSWHMYLAVGLSSLMGVGKPMCRSIVANIVKRSEANGNEIGKIFSLTASLEAMLPVLSVFLYTQVYKATITTFPGAFNLISAGIWGTIVIALIIAFRCQKVQMYRAMYQQLD